MLSSQFLGLNAHFAVNLLAALVCFAVFWLIFDAWLNRRAFSEALIWSGFLLLTAGFLVSAATLSSAEVLSAILAWSGSALKLAGLLAICAGQILEPLQKVPKITDTDLVAGLMNEPAPAAPAPAKAAAKPRHRKTAAPAVMAFGGISLPLLGGLVTLGALSVAMLYWRRSVTGLERHLRPVAHAFACIALAELAGTVSQATTTNNPLLEQLTAEFGPVWWAGHSLLGLGAVILGRWVWNYLTKRLMSQLFMVLIGQAMAIFLITTIGFTYMLLRDIKAATLTDLTTASKVLSYAIGSRQSETIAQAETVAGLSKVAAAVTARDPDALNNTLSDYFVQHQLSTLIVTDNSGVVLLRAEDPDRWGDSRSSNQLVRRALVGQSAADVVVSSGVAAPTVTLAAASPVRDATGLIIGSVTVGRAISNAFVDGIRASTGLASTVYGGDIRAATTLAADSPTGRAIGVKEADTAVTKQVLAAGQTYTGTTNMQNQSYLSAILPLTDVNNEPVGMLQAARPVSDLFAAANRSLQLTFLASVALILLAAYPLYRLARFLERQLG